MKHLAQRLARRIRPSIGYPGSNDKPRGVGPSRLLGGLAKSLQDGIRHVCSPESRCDIDTGRPRAPGRKAAIIALVALATNFGVLEKPARAEPASSSTPQADRQPAGSTPVSAWTFSESPLAGGPGMIPRVRYVGSVDRGFGMSAECRGSGPSIYISIDDPDAGLQRLRFDVPIPVLLRVGRAGALSGASKSAHITALLTGGYTALTNRVVIGMGPEEADSVIRLIEGNAQTSSARLTVEVAGTSGTFDLTGARDAFVILESACSSE